ncbi:MAG: Ribosomal protein S12 methylthiotransferase RimO [Planctomycetes bacterium ADurb.Bin126]|nr:MAG: Ribosomal protein S12 methylthiotransferase RimO [Planctomycetes bacterium ADurb.Bin126]HOD80184.1 radical SAM protein [Phycisphaerae bacterium]HQL71656.1 radical SAM protein [Phycisphaerae bacterium]
MRLYLINPNNPLVSLTNVKDSHWNRYRVWKPLGLLVLAGLTPPEWDITVMDENLGRPDYGAMPMPDLVGITAFTSQASRAYELAGEFRSRGVRVVMGGIHATMCQEEAMEHVDSVVAGEAESVWAHVLEDARQGRLHDIYHGRHADLADVPPARHDLLDSGYAFGSIQTTRGCPLSCSFCSVSAFNGTRYRHRPIDNVIRELKTIREKWVLMVDDNLTGISAAHLARAKDLFREMIRANFRKNWICQVTINMADDEELLDLAARAGCRGVFIGFESPTAVGLAEVGKKFNLLKGRDFKASIRRIQRHRILVVGSFIMGLDTDQPGIGRRIAETAQQYGVDILNTLFLTPLPGTRLWDQMESQGRILANDFPADWRYYTLGFPTAHYKNLSWAAIVAEMEGCERRFYSRWRVFLRVAASVLGRRSPLLSLVTNLSYRGNTRLARETFAEMNLRHADPPQLVPGRADAPSANHAGLLSVAAQTVRKITMSRNPLPAAASQSRPPVGSNPICRQGKIAGDFPV